MKIVQFEEGRFGIRKGIWPFYRYKLMGSDNCWRFRNSSLFTHSCKSHNIERVEREFRRGKGRVKALTANEVTVLLTTEKIKNPSKKQPLGEQGECETGSINGG